MKLRTSLLAWNTVADTARGVSDLAKAIAAGWSVNHNADGTHNFAWTPIPYNSVNYRGDGAMTWTVPSSAARVACYMQRGRALSLAIEAQLTSVGGTPDKALLYKIPNNWAAARRLGGPLAISDNGTHACGWWLVVPGERYVRFYRDPQAGANWTASASTTTVIGAMEFEVV